MMRRLRLREAVLGTACALAMAASAAAQAKAIDIPAGDLKSGLDAYIQQSGVQLIYKVDDVQGLSTRGTHGATASADTLRKLLDGTGLVVHQDSSGAIIVSKVTSPKNAEAAPEWGAAMETVTVTGTHIRGLDNPVSPTLSYSRTQIQASGFTNTDDFVRSIPQNFGGGQLGASPDGAIGPSANGGNNIAGASALNLRGLGESSTLTLLDGHRLAPAAFGGFVDISQIPIQALERVDVVVDGASAVYGSDAVSGVANFILRKDFDGAETSAQFGTVTDGGLTERTVSQVLGKQWDDGGAVLTLQYHDRGGLSTSERPFTAAAPQPTNLVNPFTKYSLIFNAYQNITADLELFADAFVTRDRTGLVLTRSPAPDDTTVQHTASNANNFNGGLRYRPFGDWLIEASVNYNEESMTYGFSENPSSPTGVFGTYQDSMGSYELNASGTLFTLPGGDVKLAIGGSDRNERGLVNNSALGNPNQTARRNVLAEYAELYVPFVSQSNSMPFVQQLSLSAAVRHDHYSDFGDTTNPKVGVSWTPVSDLDVKSTWGTAFRAPSIGELFTSSLGAGQAFLFTYPVENAAGTGTQPIFINQSYNKPLSPEKAHTWTVGFDYHPSFLEGAKLSVDYYDVDYRDRIVRPPFDTGVLARTSIYGSLLTPFANDAQAAAYLAAFVAQPGAQFLDFTGTGSAGVRYAYNLSLQNAAVSNQTGFDIQGDYSFAWGANDFNAHADLAIIDHINTQYSATSVPNNQVNTYSNPPRFRMRDELSWNRGEYHVNAALNYTNSYTDTSATPYGTVGAFTTLDVNLRYDPEFIPGFSGSLSVLNITHASPPYVAGGVGYPGIHYDVGNASPLGRFISIELQQTW
jgi:outer membrane receptor protein involved in Fe transport